MKRIYHPYTDWEEYSFGMWSKLDSKKESQMLDEAIRFTGNAQEYGSWMIRVAKEWKVSCEHNLTDTTQNRRAWIGHAACCLALMCPEYITRQAWSYLTKTQQDEANAMADKAISYWEENNIIRSDYAQELF